MSAFSEPLRQKIESYLTRYETRRSAILPVLHAIQDEYGWIQPEHIEELHERYELDRVHVKEVISFYDIYKDVPTRKFVLRFCNHMTCGMRGARAAIKRIEGHIERLEASMGADCPFQLETFPCLGKCDGAPVMLVNKERFEGVTEDKVDDILSKFARI